MLHTNDKIVKHKVGLLNLADELGNISKACKMMGVSRDTFYRYREAVNDGGVEALKNGLNTIIEEIKRVNGVFIPIWHNESLGEWGKWKGYTEAFELMFELASN